MVVKKIGLLTGIIFLSMLMVGCKAEGKNNLQSADIENTSYAEDKQAAEIAEETISEKINAEDKKETENTVGQEENKITDEVEVTPKNTASVKNGDGSGNTSEQEANATNDDNTNRDKLQEVTESAKDTKKEQVPEKSSAKASVNSSVVEPSKVENKSKNEDEQSVVTLTINGDGETILSNLEVKIEANETVFDVLAKALKEQKIQMEYSGSGESVYIEGINNLYEFDKGATSGWMYSINGVYSSKSAGADILQPGDCIEWQYTLNLGKDLGVGDNK